ncbi:MAG TPA: SAM-dependent methyltransferase [Thermoanaerobaculia bacterium]|nr:SAM-dependent methyltransferase [Thermoanaerobaculia bacterium]
MSGAEPLIRNISDTARWAALYRALETERSNPLFRDPFARRLAGSRGEQIADSLPAGRSQAWAWVTRTYLFDRFIAEQIGQGVDMVLNLAAGLDARPYRMALPPTLRWMEVDLPALLDYKEEILAGEVPVCVLERVRLDLADVPARRKLFERLERETKRALVVTEGLLIYLTADEVHSLARDLATVPGFTRWVLDIVSPGLLKMLLKQWGGSLDEAGAPLKFAPAEGPEFFRSSGWESIESRSVMKTAAHLKRAPLGLRLLAKLPEPKGLPGKRPWSAVCLLENYDAAAAPL